MKQLFRYGKSEIELALPDGKIDVLTKLRENQKSEEDHVLEAIERSSVSLHQFLGNSRSVVIIVSDQTRDTGSRVYLPILLPLTRRKNRKVTIVVAGGLHRPATLDEIQHILGCDPGPGVEIINHNADAFLSHFGDGDFNTAVVEAERIILTGSVTFHPMAGFSGGWKSLLPGVASRESVIGNHMLYFSGDGTDPRVGPAQVDGNPIHEDIVFRTRAFEKKTWCLNVVQDESKAIIHAAAGSVESAWRTCVAFLKEYNTYPIQRQYSSVIASSGGYPSDFSFYQSMKTLTNASRACIPGGSVYLMMECGNGWELDSDLRSLSNLELRQVAISVKRDFSMSGLAVYMALSIIRNYKVYCFSSLPANEVSDFGMCPLSSAHEIERLISDEKSDRIAVLPSSASILPEFTGN